MLIIFTIWAYFCDRNIQENSASGETKSKSNEKRGKVYHKEFKTDILAFIKKEWVKGGGLNVNKSHARTKQMEYAA